MALQLYEARLFSRNHDKETDELQKKRTIFFVFICPTGKLVVVVVV